MILRSYDKCGSPKVFASASVQRMLIDLRSRVNSRVASLLARLAQYLPETGFKMTVKQCEIPKATQGSECQWQSKAIKICHPDSRWFDFMLWFPDGPGKMKPSHRFRAALAEGHCTTRRPSCLPKAPSSGRISQSLFTRYKLCPTLKAALTKIIFE